MLPVIYSDEFEHKTGVLHPEKPERLRVIATALRATAFANQLEWRLPTPLKRQGCASIERVHSTAHQNRPASSAARGVVI